jgi:hypothetical protein
MISEYFKIYILARYGDTHNPGTWEAEAGGSQAFKTSLRYMVRPYFKTKQKKSPLWD